MPNIQSLEKDSDKVNLINNRWESSSDLFGIVEKTYKKNKKIWENQPDWVANVPRKRSKARDNRTFLATESVINSLTGRPSMPNVIPANESDEAGVIADELQDFFLAKYRDLSVKNKMRKGIRNLFFSRFIALKVFWNNETDDFDVETQDPRKVRVSKNATSCFDTEFAIFENTKPLKWMLDNFPEKKTDILEKTGYSEKENLAYIHNPDVNYKEAWIDGHVMMEFQGIILEDKPHPYWDWDGIKMTPNENMKFRGINGKDRRVEARKLKEMQEKRNNSTTKYESYLYNHFDKPIPPLVFGTILEIDSKPVGDTSLIEQVEPLQIEIDKRKRQISDNAEMMNGKWKFDTNLVQVTKADAQAMASSPRGIIYGKGVLNGVTMETGKELPSFIKDDLNHSVMEIDNIFGTQPTFRGEQGTKETATGRAILREQSFQRLDELIDLVDRLHYQLYNWWYQMIRVRYTESHLVKPIGATNANRVIELTRDDLQEGVEIQIIPGQIMPEDRMFKSERAKEDAVAGLIDPLTYFEETQRDNPMKYAKRLAMYRLNPLSILDLDDEDMQAIQQANALLGGGQQQQDPRAQAMGQARQEAEALMASPEFQKLSPDKQKAAMTQIRSRLGNLGQAK